MPVLEWGGRPARITCTVAAESRLMGHYEDNGIECGTGSGLATAS